MQQQLDKALPEKNILYPPGGILIWGLVGMELFTFSVVIIALLVSAKDDPEAFHASRLLLNPLFGVINTVLLLTSGYFMAASVKHYKIGNTQLCQKLILITLLGGVGFLVLKGIEYNDKIAAGLTLRYDVFFTYYWLLTVFHVIHVIAGLVILVFLYFRIKKNTPVLKLEDYEAGAAFWHMCDLIWLILFPALYLLV